MVPIISFIVLPDHNMIDSITNIQRHSIPVVYQLPVWGTLSLFQGGDDFLGLLSVSIGTQHSLKSFHSFPDREESLILFLFIYFLFILDIFLITRQLKQLSNCTLMRCSNCKHSKTSGQRKWLIPAVSLKFPSLPSIQFIIISFCDYRTCLRVRLWHTGTGSTKVFITIYE